MTNTELLTATLAVVAIAGALFMAVDCLRAGIAARRKLRADVARARAGLHYVITSRDNTDPADYARQVTRALRHEAGR